MENTQKATLLLALLALSSCSTSKANESDAAAPKAPAPVDVTPVDLAPEITDTAGPAEKPPKTRSSAPVTIRDVEISRSTDRYGNMMLVHAIAEVHQDIGSRRSLATKISCRQGERVIAESDWLRPTEGELPQAGGEVPVMASFFGHEAMDELPASCEMEVFLWPLYENSGPTAVACYDGSTTLSGRCQPGVLPAKLSAGTGAATVTEIRIEPVPASARFRLRATVVQNEVSLIDSKIITTMACEVGDKKIIDTDEYRLSSGIPLAVGEASIASGIFFAKYWLKFESPPSTCDVRVAKSTGRLASETTVTELYAGCYRNATITNEPCTAKRAKASKASAPGPSSITIDRAQLSLREISGGKLNVEHGLDITAQNPILPGYQVAAQAQCKSAAGEITSITRVVDIDLAQLASGETTRARGSDYIASPGFLDGSESCNLTYYASPAPTPYSDLLAQREAWVPLGQYCYSKDTVSVGTCR